MMNLIEKVVDLWKQKKANLNGYLFKNYLRMYVYGLLVMLIWDLMRFYNIICIDEMNKTWKRNIFFLGWFHLSTRELKLKD